MNLITIYKSDILLISYAKDIGEFIFEIGNKSYMFGNIVRGLNRLNDDDILSDDEFYNAIDDSEVMEYDNIPLDF